jgi:membrane-associated protease RseP (regulator of RpoE activity)
MKTATFAITLQAVLLAGVHAQSGPEVPLMRPEEAETVQRQTIEFFDAIRPASQRAVASTVWVWTDTTGRGKRPVVYGTVIGDGSEVLTKWSEIAMARGPIQVVGGDGKTATATVKGVYQDEDLALLSLKGASYLPVDLSKVAAPKLGSFLIAASPDDTPASVGVVAVEARSLREKDQAFLGVRLDPEHEGTGVRILGVEEESGALDAGLKEGDLILSVGGRVVNSLIEMRTALAGFGPGERVTIRYQRDGAEATVDAELKEKSESFPQFPNQRLRQMERMGTTLSLVRSGFPSVIQTDMQLERDHCGGPVVDLDGRFAGVSIARADRTRSFIIPTQAIAELLEREPVAPQDALDAIAREKEERQQVGQAGPPPGGLPPGAMPRQRSVPVKPGQAENLRRHLEDMERLMERMRAEMQGIGE